MGTSLRTEVLAQLRSMGSDMKRPHGFDFYLYFPTEPVTRKAADDVCKRQFTVKVVRGASGNDWLCLATTTIVPEISPLDEIGTFLQQIADRYGGNFDGWESDVIKI